MFVWSFIVTETDDIDIYLHIVSRDCNEEISIQAKEVQGKSV